jgi:hypothetical protein
LDINPTHFRDLNLDHLCFLSKFQRIASFLIPCICARFTFKIYFKTALRSCGKVS